MSKVYGYCRLALANEEEIAQQIKMIDDYCKDNGLTVDKYFCDNGASGISLDRKGLNELLEVLQKDDVIIVKNIARLSRSFSQCMSLLEQIKDLNITLLFIE